MNVLIEKSKPMNKVLQYGMLLILVVIISCGKETDDNQYIANELQQYFDQFEVEAAQYDIEVDIDDLDLSGYIENIQSNGTVGQCKIYSDGMQEVVIDERYWSRIGYAEKEFLVFHELGHCILGRDHDDSEIVGDICKSIMRSGLTDCSVLYDEVNRELYIKELFEN